MCITSTILFRFSPTMQPMSRKSKRKSNTKRNSVKTLPQGPHSPSSLPTHGIECQRNILWICRPQEGPECAPFFSLFMMAPFTYFACFRNNCSCFTGRELELKVGHKTLNTLVGQQNFTFISTWHGQAPCTADHRWARQLPCTKLATHGKTARRGEVSTGVTVMPSLRLMVNRSGSCCLLRMKGRSIVLTLF